MLAALTRPPSRSIARCELTHLTREPIDFEAACAQHRAFCGTLKRLGCRPIELAPQHEMPDAVFVEDAAVVVDELAVITRPGAESRRGELASVERALAEHRPIARIQAPGTLDGGDVLRVERTVIVGLSSRTNEAGAEQLASLLAPHGYDVRTARTGQCLHFLSACTYIGRGVVLVNPRWVDPATFDEFEIVEIDPSEPRAANAVRVGETLVHADAFPKTQARLRERGFNVAPVNNTELAKAEGAVTCCSVLFETK
jgi:dimethylargininase